MDEKINTIKNWLGTGSINFFGRPFAGKDTQGIKIAEMFNGVLVAGGDILRSYPDQDKINSLMSTGELFPSDLYLDIVLPYLSKPEFATGPLMMSAVGRSHGEGPIIMHAAEKSGHPMKAVVVLDLTEEEVWKRFKASQEKHDRGDRADDHEEVLRNRLQKYQEKTTPVIDYYREQGLLIEIDGTLTEEEVTQEILDVLEARAKS